MRALDLGRPAARGGDLARLARLTRHLRARLEDLGPGGPQVLSACEDSGRVSARFPGRSGAEIAGALEGQFQVRVRAEGGLVVFQLSPEMAFEDLDYLWGCLFTLLG